MLLDLTNIPKGFNYSLKTMTEKIITDTILNKTLHFNFFWGGISCKEFDRTKKKNLF